VWSNPLTNELAQRAGRVTTPVFDTDSGHGPWDRAAAASSPPRRLAQTRCRLGLRASNGRPPRRIICECRMSVACMAGVRDPGSDPGIARCSTGVLRCSLQVAASPQTLAASVFPLAAPDPRWPVSFKDQRIEYAMMQPPYDSGIKLTQHSPWVWHVSRDGKRVGTVSGDRVGGFTARDVHYNSIGRGYVSAEAAIQAWIPVTYRHR